MKIIVELFPLIPEGLIELHSFVFDLKIPQSRLSLVDFFFQFGFLRLNLEALFFINLSFLRKSCRPVSRNS